MIVIQLVLYCALFTLMVKLCVGNDPIFNTIVLVL